jgi:tRNA (guanine-N7-)-methyltransferase
MGENQSREAVQSRGELTLPQPRYRLYGRRKGHTLRRHHLALLQDVLPKLRIDLAVPDLDAARPMRLEIGFGGGERLAQLAERHPKTLFLGAESFVNGVAKLLALIEAKSLSNIRIHDGDARNLLEHLPTASLDHVDILYPDPWPKTRHQRRRLINQATLIELHRLLKPSGHLIVATDIADYAAWTLSQIRAHGGFEWLAQRPSDWRAPPAEWTPTRYETKAIAAGRVPIYLEFRRISRASEPVPGRV